MPNNVHQLETACEAANGQVLSILKEGFNCNLLFQSPELQFYVSSSKWVALPVTGERWMHPQTSLCCREGNCKGPLFQNITDLGQEGPIALQSQRDHEQYY